MHMPPDVPDCSNSSVSSSITAAGETAQDPFSFVSVLVSSDRQPFLLVHVVVGEAYVRSCSLTSGGEGFLAFAHFLL